MSKLTRFEDLQAWQKARQLANAVYELTASPKFDRDNALRNQMRRAASSVMHNIAEGFDAGSDAEFSRFLRIARRSASEVQSELYLALDQKLVSSEDQARVYALATEAKKLTNAMHGYLSRSRNSK